MVANRKVPFFLWIVVLFVSPAQVVWAQRQADVIWAGHSFFCVPQEAPARNFILKFNEDSLEYIDNETPIILTGLDSRAAYADRQGNFKFASNGWRLVNSSGEVLSYKLWREDIPWSGGSPDTTMVRHSKGPLFLEDPADSNRVYLFYGQSATNMPSPIGLVRNDVLFSYALLDVPSQSIISFHHDYLTDTTSLSDAMAVRHGNGRDWWILKPGLFTNEYYRALLDPSGVSNMEKITIPGLLPRAQTTTVSHFTQDGNTFIHFTGLGPKWVQRYDFDRCSGELSNTVETDLRPLFREQDPCNFTISPDGSKFYAVRLNYNDSNYLAGNYQYDFETESLTFLSDTSYISFLTPNFKEIFVFNRLTPTTLTELYFESIENPNGLGFDCNIHFQKHRLQNFPYMLYAPCFANYRLGPLAGSACDTLGSVTVGAPVKPLSDALSIFPNPSREVLHVRFQGLGAQPTLLTVYNSMGQVLHRQLLEQEYTTLQSNTLNLPTGVYTVQVQSGRQAFTRKWVKL